MTALDRPVMLLWLVASLLWAAILATSAFRIQRSRGRWRESMLDGMPVYMSHDVGPALFGLTRFGIVVPGWVAELKPEQRRLIVAHEREHARAGDPVTLLVGALLVLLQPLNVAMWMMFRRLRLAIEIDCDARVLAGTADVRAYGDLLLDVGERTLTGAAPVAALSEGGAQLERRIVAMSRSARPHLRTRALFAAAASVALALAAWQLPLPEVARAGEVPVGIRQSDVANFQAEAANLMAERTNLRAEPARLRAQPPAQGPESHELSPRSGTSAAGGRPIRVTSDTIHGRTRRTIVLVNRLVLNDASSTPEILVWPVDGPVRVAIGGGAMQPLVDTLRLDHLPALRFDVTEGHALMRLVNGGTMSLGADVQGGGAERFTVEAAQIAFLRGGRGVAHGDDLPERLNDSFGQPVEAIPNSMLRRIVGDRFPGLLQSAGSAEYVWLLLDGEDRVLQSNRGLGNLPRRSDGQLGFVDADVARTMLPLMWEGARMGEGYGWRQIPARSGHMINVIWVRQLSGTRKGPSPSLKVRQERAAARADVVRLSEERFAALFAGIDLSPAVAPVARSIVLEEYFNEFDYPPHGKGLKDILAAQERRDARLVALLETPADRERFRRNADERRAWEFRDHREYQRRSGGATGRGGHP